MAAAVVIILKAHSGDSYAIPTNFHIKCEKTYELAFLLSPAGWTVTVACLKEKKDKNHNGQVFKR